MWQIVTKPLVATPSPQKHTEGLARDRYMHVLRKLVRRSMFTWWLIAMEIAVGNLRAFLPALLNDCRDEALRAWCSSKKRIHIYVQSRCSTFSMTSQPYLHCSWRSRDSSWRAECVWYITKRQCSPSSVNDQPNQLMIRKGQNVHGFSKTTGPNK